MEHPEGANAASSNGDAITEKGIAVAVFALLSAVFIVSPVGQMSDSRYALVVSSTLLSRGSFSIDPDVACKHQSDSSSISYDCPLNIEQVGDRFFYYFPPGTSILSTPAVWALSMAGISPLKRDGSYNERGERIAQRLCAALLMAGLTVFFYLTARLVLSAKLSLVLAAAAALGTQVWSTASRGLWSHTWGIFLMGWVVYLLLRAAVRGKEPSPYLLATLLAWAYFVRPTFAVAAIGVGAYSAFRNAREIPALLITGIAWGSLFVLYSLLNFATVLPSYYATSRLGSGTFLEGFLGNLLSPHRGTLVYVPLLVWTFVLLVRYRNRVDHRPLLWLALSIVCSHFLLISDFAHWWGGWAFGARMTTDLVPWFFLLLVLGVDAATRELQPRTGHRVERALVVGAGALLIGCSVFINGRGALSRDTMKGGITHEMVARDPGVLWDWAHPQFLHGFRHIGDMPSNSN